MAREPIREIENLAPHFARSVVEIMQHGFSAKGEKKPPETTPSDEEIIDWCERDLGLKLRGVPRVLAILSRCLEAFRQKKMLRLAVLGPRGGGKTKLTAAIELVAYRFFGYSWQNVGASLEQAQRCYSYIEQAHFNSPALRSFTTYSQARETRSNRGDVIEINAASQKSIRGAHPVGSSGGGGLTLDEAALIPDDICDASKGQLTSAKPSALIQLSTMGEQQVGRFWDLLQEPKKVGYELLSFDVFDVAERCPYDCKTTCPIREHFAEDYYEGQGDLRQLVHKAYCGGRAHEVDGWIPIDEIAQQYREQDRGTFERELLGKATSIVGSVYDPVLVRGAEKSLKIFGPNLESHRRRFLALEKFVGIDFGFSGQTAVCYGLRLQDILVVYRWNFFTREKFTTIREHIVKTCIEERIETILGDSASPNELQELSELASERAVDRGIDWNPRVLPVVFSKWKTFLIGAVRARLEKGTLKFASQIGDEHVIGHEQAIKYLLAYHTDEKGTPVKVDDHGPDALLCLVAGMATGFRAATAFVGK